MLKRLTQVLHATATAEAPTADGTAPPATTDGTTPPAETAKAEETATTTAVAGEGKTQETADSETGPKAPEKYELTLPESSQATSEDVKAFEEWARSLNMTNDQAQAAIDAQADFVVERAAAFKSKLEADPDYGGTNLTNTQRLIEVALKAVRPEGHPRRGELMAILENTGYINHPAIASLLADFGRMADEDSTGGGGSGAVGDVPMEDAMFPSTAKKN